MNGKHMNPIVRLTKHVRALTKVRMTYMVAKDKPKGLLRYKSCGYNVIEITEWGGSLLIEYPLRH
jgi:hypothetical protein